METGLIGLGRMGSGIAKSLLRVMPTASVLRGRFLTAMARGNEKKDWSVIGRIAAQDAGLSSKSTSAS
jgi:hypothetical protein